MTPERLLVATPPSLWIQGGLVSILILVASALAPTVVLVAATMFLAGLLFKRWPVAILVLFGLIEPLQALLTHDLPPIARILDELAVIGIGFSTLGPLAIRSPARFLRDPFVAAAWVFFLLGIASARVNQVPLQTALAGLFVTLDYVILFLSIRALRPRPDAARVLIVSLLCLGVISTLVATGQQLFDGMVLPWQVWLVESGVTRVPGPFVHPNALGYFMLTATFLGVGSALTTKKLGFWVIAIVCALGLFLSVSRSSYVALFLGLCVGGLLVNRRILKVGLLLGLLAVTVFGPVVLGGLKARYEKFQVEGGDARLTFLVKSLPILEAHPLLGVGPGRFGGEVARRYGSPVYAANDIRFEGSWTTVDDYWLHLGVEQGALGVLGLLCLLGLLLRQSLKRLRHRHANPYEEALLLAVPMLIAAFLFINLTSMAFEDNESAGVFWLVAGVALAGSRPWEQRPAVDQS